jgi:DNA-binding SARP family transcriptional activator/TolB-like protein
VLALVARAGDRGIKREKLLTLLWPDADEETGRAAISQALHLLRRDTGSDELFLGVQDLRLNHGVATCDVLEFESAMSSGDIGRAAVAYAGPFLEGFRVPGARELDRWIEEERSALAQRNAELLERLGRAETERGDHAKAVSWWRRRAALDPLNARVTVELMKALDAAGERAAAIQQARIYEALMKQELAIEPDGSVLRLAAELRARSVEAVKSVETVKPAPSVVEGAVKAVVVSGDAEIEQQPVDNRLNRPNRPNRRFALLGAVLLAATVALAFALRRPTPAPSSPMLAIGTIRDYRDAAASSTGLVTDMLATNLARVPGIQVISTLRMLELVDRQKGGQGDAAVAAAARAGGATELMEGAVHALDGGSIVLELRRVDLASGAVRSAYRVEAANLYELVNKATQEISSSVGRPSGTLDPSGVSTASAVAYGFYERGVREYVRGDLEKARANFDAALEQDSSFVMAAYHRFLVGDNTGRRWPPEKQAWLKGMADRAPERERLLIRGHVAITLQEAGALAYAETLAVRYPLELDGHLMLGVSRMVRAEFAQAIPPLERVLALDSTSIGSGSLRCQACDALVQLAFAWHSLDSLQVSLRLARDWVARDSGSIRAWNEVARMAFILGHEQESLDAWSRVATLGTAYRDIISGAIHLIRGRFAEAERTFRSGVESGLPAARFEAQWYLAILLRHQGRWEESARIMRERAATYTPAERAQDLDYLPRIAEALALYEAGRADDAIRIWDSIATRPNPAVQTGDLNRRQVFLYALLTDAAYAARDTVRAARYADSGAAWASRSNNPRDERLADHARGVRLLARGDTAQAVTVLRRAIFSPTIGFTRTNLVLARVLTATGRPAEAALLMQQALRGGTVEGTSLYATHTALHEELGHAFLAMGQRDSARVHFDYVARAFERSDPVAKQRLEAARRGAQ